MGADTMTHKGSPSGGGAMVMMALWGLLALLAITLGAKAVDTPYAIHMFIFALAAILALIFKARSFGKPAEDTSLSALRLGELLLEAGLPAGVLNIVTGLGGDVGAALAAHPEVDKIAFTGSTATGRAVLDAAKTTFKRVTLELGGKSPSIVLPDADLSLAIPGVANAIYFNGGQVCIAGSRLYVHRSKLDEVVSGVASYAKGLQLGHGLDPATQMGPVVSARHAERVEGFITRARAEGASVLVGGERTGDAGTFIEPTLLVDVRPDMEIVREEVSGPKACPPRIAWPAISVPARCGSIATQCTMPRFPSVG
mgnify:CR=1 FL=1